MRPIRATFALAFLALLWPATGPAAVTCTGSRDTGVVRVISDGNDGFGIVKGPTGRIEVNGVTCQLGGGGPLVDATVQNTTTIRVTGGNGAFDQSLGISLFYGSFAPGAGSEAGIAEIEFEVDLGPGQDTITVGGSHLGDTLAFGSLGAALNSDGDRDVSLSGVEGILIFGGFGNDLLTAAGGFGTGAVFTRDFVARGSEGDDQVTGGRGEDQLFGDQGDDRLAGGGGADDLFGLGGRDLLVGGRGRDEMRAGDGRDILSARDGIRELVHGGPRRDRAKVDRRDRIRAVEVLVDRLPHFRWGGD
jgi:Ca2+-binding RTX toxin-like protein